nr:Putative tick transposon [Haemonchus contortus]
MTSLTVLHVLRRFMATVGCPTFILCDNALAFKAIAKCFSSLSDPEVNEDVLDYCTKRRVHFEFIPSLSPSQGGVYEKMIDIYKKSYRHAIGGRILNIEDH